MAYDEILARRVRAQLEGVRSLQEKKLFGGVGFLVNGNLACGVNGSDLIVRVGAEKHSQALSRPHTRVFDMTGRPMAGWVMVAPQGCQSDPELKAWVQSGLDYAGTLPAK